MPRMSSSCKFLLKRKTYQTKVPFFIGRALLYRGAQRARKTKYRIQIVNDRVWQRGVEHAINFI